MLCGRVCLGNGGRIGAATDAGIILGLDPYRGSAHAPLKKAHIAEGNPAQTVAAYARLHEVLPEALGTVASLETAAVCRAATGRR